MRWSFEEGDSEEHESIRHLVDWEIALSADNVHATLSELANDDRWATVLPDLLPDFSGLLHDALDLMRELDGADDRSDLSYVHQPSISDHPQNRNFPDWTALIELTRDAWLALCLRSREQARITAEAWWQKPYPLFRRLAFLPLPTTTSSPRAEDSSGC